MAYKSIFDTNGDIFKAVEPDCVLENALKDEWDKISTGEKAVYGTVVAGLGALYGWIGIGKLRDKKREKVKKAVQEDYNRALSKVKMTEQQLNTMKNDINALTVRAYNILRRSFPNANLGTDPTQIKAKINKLNLNSSNSIRILLINMKQEWANVKDGLGFEDISNFENVDGDDLYDAYEKEFLNKIGMNSVMKKDDSSYGMYNYRKIPFYQGCGLWCDEGMREWYITIDLDNNSYYLSESDVKRILPNSEPVKESTSILENAFKNSLTNVVLDDEINGNYTNKIGLPTIEEMRSMLTHTADKLHGSVPDFVSTLSNEMKDCFGICNCFTGAYNKVHDATKLSNDMVIPFLKFCPGKYKYYNQIRAEEEVREYLKGITPEAAAYNKTVEGIINYFNSLICNDKKDYIILDKIGADEGNISEIKYCVRFNKDIDVSKLAPGYVTSTPKDEIVEEGIGANIIAKAKTRIHNIRNKFAGPKKEKISVANYTNEQFKELFIKESTKLVRSGNTIVNQNAPAFKKLYLNAAKEHNNEVLSLQSGWGIRKEDTLPLLRADLWKYTNKARDFYAEDHPDFMKAENAIQSAFQKLLTPEGQKYFIVNIDGDWDDWDYMLEIKNEVDLSTLQSDKKPILESLLKDIVIESVSNKVKAGALAAAGLGAIAASRNAALGKKKMYHGTSKENWESIKNEGLKANKGGNEKGLSSQYKKGNPEYVENSKNHVYMSGIKKESQEYANSAGNGNKFGDDIEGIRKSQSTKSKDGKVVKANIDYRKYKKMEADPDSFSAGDLEGHKQDRKMKKIASRGNEDITPEEIKGSKASVKDKIKHTVKELPSYIKEHPGRFAAGVAGTTAGAYLIKKAHDVIKESYDLEKEMSLLESVTEAAYNGEFNILELDVMLEITGIYDDSIIESSYESLLKDILI